MSLVTTIKTRLTLSLFISILYSAATLAQAPEALPSFQTSFDNLGPTVQNITANSGRQIHFIDDGNQAGLPVVFTGGLGTSVRVIRLLDFLRTLRQDLNLRFITVERNGFGQTTFDDTLTMDNYAEDVEQVLQHLGIDNFAVFGISGGGPYTAKIAQRNASRLLSIHMAATSPSIGNPQRCSGDTVNPYAEMLRYPMQFFGFAQNSPLHQIEGFQDSAFDEAARAHNLRGQSADPAPLLHELSLYCTEQVIDSAHITAPVFVYLGLKDQVLGKVEPNDWLTAYPKAEVLVRTYPNGGHDVQYRHLDQILLDIAGFGDEVLICKNGVQIMVASAIYSAQPNSSLGLCAWAD